MNSATIRDLVERGERVYEAQLKDRLERSNLHDYVAIEPVSGDHFIGKTMTEAGLAAARAHPDRLTHMIRIGHAATVEVGSGE